MKKFRRGLAMLLLVCMVATFLPPITKPAKAAEVIRRYELDTDGIDPGADYLIVNTGTAGKGNALMFYYGGSYSRDFRNQSVTVTSDEDGVRYISAGFSNESDCTFRFSSASSGTIKHGNYFVNLSGSNYATSAPSNTLTFTTVGSGAYRISYSTSSWWNSTNYYLRYSNSDWSRSTTSSTVYLYKLVEKEVSHTVSFDGNGFTSGQLPADAINLKSGTEYTIPQPVAELRKDVGEDTWLFLCWNTKADGSGVEYAPGEKITVTEDLVLYADWYLQTKYTVAMITYLDGVRTDVDVISGQNKQFFVQREGGDGTYIPLKRTDAGTYTAKVVENGDYIVYAQVDGGAYEPVHGHQVVIFNQSGETDCQHFSVNYDLNGGSWAEGQNPGTPICHALEDVTLTNNIPALAGNRFLGWEDQDGNLLAPGSYISAVNKKITLSARWEKTVSVSVQIAIDHKPVSGGSDTADSRDEVTFQVMRTDENGYSHLVDTITVSEENSGKYLYTYDEENDVTTYTLPEGVVTLSDLQKGVYTVSVAKSHYDVVVTAETDADGNVSVQIKLQYVPSSFDLDFDVVVKDWEQVPQQLRPQAVNIRVLCWGYDEDGKLGWRVISQQAGTNPPVTVTIDPATGKGHGFYPVWQYWPSDDGVNHPYVYRVQASSYVMPDGSLRAASGENNTTYSAGIYTGTVTIEPGAAKPDYPDEGLGTTDLTGTRYDAAAGQQDSTPTVSVAVTPFTVTFVTEEGTIQGVTQLQLQNQFLYPDLNQYKAESADKTFGGWLDENGKLAENLGGQLLTGNVTYTARYNDLATISGDIAIAATYEMDGETIEVNKTDRPDAIVVVLQRQIGEMFVDVAYQTVPLNYRVRALVGISNYEFKNLPNDGTVYRVQALTVNYDDRYDNNQDSQYAKTEAVAILDPITASAQLDIRMDFAPESYQQKVRVDATQIAAGMRPTDALVEILYRDLGDVHNYQVISQHTVEPYGMEIAVDTTGIGQAEEPVWSRHIDGAPYEYQIQLSKLYGSVEGAYTAEGLEYDRDRPFTVVYGMPNNYLRQAAETNTALEATLVPKQYKVFLDLNLDTNSHELIMGMDRFLADDGTGNSCYAYTHVWSYGDQFEAFPYREGYVFKGWLEHEGEDLVVDNGTIYVGATLAKNVTLTAQWEKLSGTDYSIRYLELNTDKVLHGAKAVKGAAEGGLIRAVDAAISIEGYRYAGAKVNGVYMDKYENPAMTITGDPPQNLMTIYYLPDESSGYTEQVEENMGAGKTAVLEDDGTYTITLDTYTTDSPITTMIKQDTPMDIVLVLDQSGSMYFSDAVDDLKDSVENFISLIAEHGRTYEVDHRVAIVGYASDETSGYSNNNYPSYAPNGGYSNSQWVNTGVFDSHGSFHIYPVTGFNYEPYTGDISADGIYYTYANGQYLLLTYHEEYRHLITEEEARQAVLQGTTVFGYVEGQFLPLTRNTSGLWLYGDKQLYSDDKYFTYHTNVWTHREGVKPRQIHGYMVNGQIQSVDGHGGIFTRTETRDPNPQVSIYEDTLVPVSTGAGGAGSVTPGLQKATQNIGANGLTYVSYGMEMANSIFEANPLEAGSNRIRFVVVFTDGKPGDSSNFNETESNKALEQSYITTHTYGADVYTIGLYGDDVVSAESDQDFFMNGLSSNYPNAKSMDDVWVGVTYKPAISGYRLNNGGPYFVKVGESYYELSLKSLYQNRVYYNCWGYIDASGNRVDISVTEVAAGHPVIQNNMVGGQTIYRRYGNGYQETPNSGYYMVAENAQALKIYFANVVKDITTKTTTEIVLKEDTILRDIMNQGFVLTDGTVITAYLQGGNYDTNSGEIHWAIDENGQPILEEKVRLELGSGETSIKDTESGVAIHVYNLDAKNATRPNEADYLPHTVDVTGYNFAEWFINKEKTFGYKLVVKITRIEATEDVQWGRSTYTNNNQSGIWLPADANGNRQLLLAFKQPSTIFVERAYVLDYGKEFTLSGWYFDDENGKEAEPVHLDFDLSDGMNWFDTASPNVANSNNSPYGNLSYGNARLENGQVSYAPATMNWGGYDQFYVFGNTWRKTVLAQNANANGNLWNKVTVIPANNIYYEDSFITESSDTQNGIEGFTFTGQWQVVSGDNAGENTEVPEHVENAPYGDVHGWTDSLGDDLTFTDDSAHGTGLDGGMGASAEFRFTGTGVDVYTRTNMRSGMVVAVLTREYNTGKTEVVQSIAVDNLAASGDYYHIPTVSFRKLPYGTYSLRLIATAAATATGTMRYEYYIDGIRVYNPLGSETNYQDNVVQNAYDLETNAIFTEIRDVLLDYGDFNTGLSDDLNGKMGAVFIDWIQPGQEGEGDQPGQELGSVTGQPSYNVGTFENYGPKNEVYLSAGQAIVLKVAEGNTYYVGIKSLTGGSVTANVSGLNMAQPTAIQIAHTTDMYYHVTPVDGYIVIQNGNTDGAILSLTNLRTTNLKAPAKDAGILPVTDGEAVVLMRKFSAFMAQRPEQEETPETPEQVPGTTPQQQAQAIELLTKDLFAAVRRWLDTEERG